MKNFLLLLIFVVSVTTNAQTSVSGQITTNTTWTLANSPYIVTGNILVPTGVTLSIEPGVVVKVNDGLYIKNEGVIIAVGTDANQIFFESSSDTSNKNQWKGIIIRPTGGSIIDVNQNFISGSKFENVVLKNADVGLYIFNTGLYLNKSIFKYNNFGIEIRNTNGVLINNSSFIENTKGIMTEYEKYSPYDSTGNIVNTFINNCSFLKNEVGLDFMLNQRYFENLNVYNNLIKENNTGLSFSGGGYGCKVKSVFISKNIIINNSGEGLKVGQIYGYGSGLFESEPANTYPLSVEKNKIINNPVFWDFGGGVGVSVKIANNIICNLRYTLDNFSQGLLFSGGTNKRDLITNNLIASNGTSLVLKDSYSDPSNKSFLYNTFIGQPLEMSSTISVFGSGHIFNYNNFPKVISKYSIKNDFSDPIDATNNFWQTTTESEIQSSIYDNSDNFERGIVSYSPFLITPNTTAPVSPPQNVIKAKVGNDIVLSWNSNPESDIAGYKIYYGTPTGYSYANVIDAGNVNTYTIVGGNINTEYSVTAYDSSKTGVDDQVNGNESWYAVSEIVPELPTGIMADTAPRKIKLNWTLSSSDGVSSYKIYRGTTSNPTTEIGSVSSTATSFIDTSVTNGIDYFYRIKSVKPSGLASDFSANITAKSTNIWMVSKSGVVNGFGSILDPFLTIQKAVDMSSNGDTILVNPGTYSESVSVNKSLNIFSTGSYLDTVLESSNPNSPILNIFEQTFDLNNIVNVSIKGFKFLNYNNSQISGTDAMHINRGAFASVQQCWFENLNASFATYYGYFTVENSVFNSVRVISRNDAGFNDNARFPKIINCTIYNAYSIANSNPNINTKIYNSIIVSDPSNTKDYFVGSRPILDKVIIDDTPNALSGSDFSTVSNVNAIHFNDLATKDFRLKVYSPAIGYGTNMSITEDLNAGIRPLPVNTTADSGAFENGLGTPVNAPPTINTISNIIINEDDSVQTVALTGISDGDLFSTQVVAVTTTSSNLALISNPTLTYTPGDTTGSLQFTPVANQSGTATITVTVTDDAGISGGGVNTFSTSFTVTVNPVNDAPLATPQTVSTAQDTNKVITLAGTDIDTTVSSLTYSITVLPTNGQLYQTTDGSSLGAKITTVPSTVSNSDGKVIYEPVWNISGSSTGTFSFKANDGNLQSSVSTEVIVNTTSVTYPVLSISSTPLSIAEHQSSIITASLSSLLNKDVTISLESIGTATHGLDYYSQFEGKGVGVIKAGGNGTGSASNQLDFSEKIAIDNSGNLFIADYNNNRIQKWAPNSGSGETIISGVTNPIDIQIATNGDIYVLESGKVTKWTSSGLLIGIVSSGISSSPSGMFIDTNLNIYTTGYYDNSVYKSTPTTVQAIKIIDNPGGDFFWPESVVSDNLGNLYISNRNGKIVKWNASNQQISSIIYSSGIRDLAINSKGNLIVPKGGTSRQDYSFSVAEYTLAGTFVKNIIESETNASEFIGISGVALDRFDNLYVSQSINPNKYGSDFINLSKNRVMYYPFAPQIKIPAGQISAQIKLQGIEDDLENEGDEKIILKTNVVPFTSLNAPLDVEIILKDNTRKLTLVESPFVGLEYGAVSWGDYDKDGDQDVAVMGQSTSGAVTKVYENKNGEFLDSNQNFTRMFAGDIAWVDINKDGWLDLAVSGTNGSGPLTKIYINDKGTSFSSTIDFGLPQLASSKMAWGDLDNDGDIDLAMTGVDISNNFQFNIYYRDDIQNKFTVEPKTITINQSGGNMSSNYQGVIDGDIKIVDIDLDGDNDIIYNGANSEEIPYSRILYNTYIKNSINNNNLNYGNTSLSLKNSVIEVARIGSENKMSILSSGINQSGNIELYSNEPLMNTMGFTSSDLFPKLKNGDISVVDFNNDGFNDILFTGEDTSGTSQTKLYFQNSTGNFKLAPIDLAGLRNSTANWVDYDNDGDLDLFLTGVAAIEGAKTLLYKSEILNKRNTAPAIPSGLVYEDLGNGKIKFQWTPPLDDYSASLGYVVRLGTTPGGTELSNTESNLLTGDRLITKQAPIYTSFYEMQLEPGKYYWSVQAVDTGLKGGAFAVESSFTLTYDWKILNQGGIIDRSITGMEAPIVKLADLDNDNDLDLIYGNSMANGSQILQFDGKKLVAQENTGVNNIGYFNKINSSDVGDIDGDNKVDILFNHFDGTSNKLVLISSTNNVLQVGAGLFKSKSRMVDINNDGKLDIVILGLSTNVTSSATPKLWIYEYDKSTSPPSFKFKDASLDIAALSSASFDFGDIDKDQDLDLVISGFSPSSGLKSIIYENTTILGGEFKLTPTDNNIVAIKDGTTDLIDFDGDGDLDVVLTGDGGLNGDIFEIYMNKLKEGEKTWPRFNSGLTAIRNGKIDLGDFNGDGFSDILYSGTTSGGGKITKLSEYNKVTQRYADSPFDVSDFTSAEVEFGDLDGDNDLDFVIVGTNKNWSTSNSSVEKFIFRTYINVRNDSAKVIASSQTGKSTNGLKTNSGNAPISDYIINEAPAVPVLPSNATKVVSNIATTAGKYPIELSWNSAIDDHTPSPGLTYAIKIGTTPGGEQIMSANANNDGTRKVSTKGNAEHNTKWKVSLPVGKYYWSVQAIDASYSGSAFTESQVFDVSTSGVTVNNSPVAISDQITVLKGGTATKLNSNAISVLTNDTDTENNTLTAILVDNVSNGTLTFNANGTFSYVHNGSETTTDSFTYKANDGNSNSNIITVQISIVPFTIDFNNFLIETKSETCSGKNNGEISIKATQSFNYTATINSKNYNFINNSLVVPGLAPGVYNVCVNIEGQTFQQCYTLTIGKGGSLTGKTSDVFTNKVAIEITEGTAPFEVFLNGSSQFTTNQTLFDVDVNLGDMVLVKSAIACEGVYSTVISDLPNSFVAYPNPTKGSFEIAVPAEMKEIYVELYSINSALISKGIYPVWNQRIKLNLDNQTNGTYIAKVYTAIPTSLIIIKN